MFLLSCFVTSLCTGALIEQFIMYWNGKVSVLIQKQSRYTGHYLIILRAGKYLTSTAVKDRTLEVNCVMNLWILSYIGQAKCVILPNFLVSVYVVRSYSFGSVLFLHSNNIGRLVCSHKYSFLGKEWA
jgi:hypothetical protein